MGYANSAALVEELRRGDGQLATDREKIDDLILRVVQAARTPADAYAFGRVCCAALATFDNPFDRIKDRNRHFAWQAGAKEGARTDTCRRKS
jgi:hypothetical protein